MHLPRLKFRLRSMMVALLLLTPVVWVAGRQFQFQRLTRYHLLRSEADIISCTLLMTDDGKPTSLVESATGAPTTIARRDWHRVLYAKYEKAAHAPWWNVAPDPPRPE